MSHPEGSEGTILPPEVTLALLHAHAFGDVPVCTTSLMVTAHGVSEVHVNCPLAPALLDVMPSITTLVSASVIPCVVTALPG